MFAITAVTPSAPLVRNDADGDAGFTEHFATKCGVLPPPAVAQLTPPVCDFDQATSSFGFATGTLGLMAITDGATAIIPTGTRSLSVRHVERIMLFVLARRADQPRRAIGLRLRDKIGADDAPAPGLFSMMTGWPRRLETASAAARR